MLTCSNKNEDYLHTSQEEDQLANTKDPHNYFVKMYQKRTYDWKDKSRVN